MKRTPLKRKSRLRPVSKRRSVEMKEYSRLRKEFLAKHPVCYVWWKESEYSKLLISYRQFCHSVALGLRDNPCPATDVHHRCKRGKNYLATNTWLALSRFFHEKIHQNPKWAREMGYLK